MSEQNNQAEDLDDRYTPSEQKWTPEPWRRDDQALGGQEKTVCAGDMIVVQTCTNRNSRDPQGQTAKQAADLARIVQCVNALAGVADPAAELARLREEIRLGEIERDTLRTVYAAAMEECRDWRQSDRSFGPTTTRAKERAHDTARAEAGMEAL